MAFPEDTIHEVSPPNPLAMMGSLQHATLTLADSKLPVLLVDDLNECLTILVKNPPNLWVDDIGQLQTDDGLFSVRVAYALRIEADDENSPEAFPVFRIGLERLSVEPKVIPQVEVNEPSPLLEANSVNRGRLGSLFVTKRSRLFTTSCLTLILVATATVAWCSNRPLVAKAVGWGASMFHGKSASEAWANRDNPLGAEGPTDGRTAVAASAQSRVLDQARGMKGVEPFLLPDVVKELKIDSAQILTLRSLNATTHQALDSFDKEWFTDSQFEHAKKREMILDAARQEAEHLLTDDQRRRWTVLGQ